MRKDILEAGDIVDGRYQISGKLGAGGFATVYDAQHLSLHRSVAIKVLDISGISDSAYMERFSREARVSAQLDHPAIVRIFDFGQLPNGQPYIAMEKLIGHDLEVELKTSGPLTLERMLRLFVPALDGLGKAHAAGVVHKDLKPSNLFLFQPGTVSERLVIVDFGIARVMDAKTQLTQAGSFAGTPAYLAPEYIQSQVVTPALDVYQMGLIITEALSGRAVVRSESAIGYIMKHIQGEHDVPDELRKSALGALLLRSLSVDPALRFANATEFAQALAGLSGGTVQTLSHSQNILAPTALPETQNFPPQPTTQPSVQTHVPQPLPQTSQPSMVPPGQQMTQTHNQYPQRQGTTIIVVVLGVMFFMSIFMCIFCTILL